MQQNSSGLPTEFWSLSTDELQKQLETKPQGLSGNEAAQRLKRVGANRLGRSKKTGSFSLFLGQLKSPITLILLFAAAIGLRNPVSKLALRKEYSFTFSLGLPSSALYASGVHLRL